MDYSYTYEQTYLALEFEKYLKNQKASSDELSSFFDGFLLGLSDTQGSSHENLGMKLLHFYRHFGFLKAKTNPIHDNPKGPDLSISIAPDTLVNSLGFFEEDKVSFETLKNRLEQIYSGSIGYEFLHTDAKVSNFIIEHLEKKDDDDALLDDESVFRIIAQAELFETFLHTRFPGQKRFSLEGLESSMVLIEEMLLWAKKEHFQNFFFGMAHRGRLNLLANLFQKPLQDIFKEFSKESLPENENQSGDVKYHLGAFYEAKDGTTLTLSSNPSHLEAVDPVILGMAYAKKVMTKTPSLSFMIHGDASFAGQGVVYETMQIGKIKEFDSGSCIHIILNNQIGFTALPEESRSQTFASDLAKAFNCPIFHVNSEDVDALKKVASLSIKLAKEFGIDCMIDIIGYRKWGHNESDEPAFTQPLLYKKIKDKKSPLTIYKESLLARKPEIASKIESIEQSVKSNLQKCFESQATKRESAAKEEQESIARTYHDLKKLQKSIFSIPSDFDIHPKLKKLFSERLEEKAQEATIDFSQAELLAFGVTLDAGYNLRLVGQDSARGTFSQRHAVLVDQSNEKRYNIFTPLLKPNQYCQIINSPLSEYAVLGFEYGFSKVAKQTLNIWEAQFGDFANGAQIIIDQFIASGKTKWNDKSNLTLLLPHGFEGQGPEHSSARIERFLELCGDHNMKVAIPSTPSQYYHLLVAQKNSKQPLVVFTPKALLRHPLCKSTLQELESGAFEEIIDDNNKDATVCVLCYGKIYFELLSIKNQKNLNHISLVRLEQLYPFEKSKLDAILKKKPHLKSLVLIQDEPFNMGACPYLKSHLENLKVISRKESSSPATGYYGVHEKQLKDILTQFENL